jgi:hypothetical protein
METSNTQGAQGWTMQEDSVCMDEYQCGIGWEERAAVRLAHRDAAACESRGKYLHLRSSRWMEEQMRRQGMTRGQPASRDRIGRKGIGRGFGRADA